MVTQGQGEGRSPRTGKGEMGGSTELSGGWDDGFVVAQPMQDSGFPQECSVSKL